MDKNIVGLFKKFDDKNCGYVDNISFMRILNILGLPFNDIIIKNYTITDLYDHINKYNDDSELVKIKNIKAELLKHYDEMTVKYIINKVYGDIPDSRKVKISEMTSFIDEL